MSTLSLGGFAAAIALAALAALATRVLALRSKPRAGSQRAFSDILNLIPEPVVITDVAAGRFLLVNAQWEAVSGRTLAEVRGKTSRELGYWESASEREQLRARVLEQKEVHAYPIELTSLGGMRKHYEVSARMTELDGESAMLYIFRDVTREKSAFKSLEERELALLMTNRELEQSIQEISALRDELREQAIRDPLTGLHNRRFLDESLPRELERARRDAAPLSLVMIDLDHFKTTNDTHGHAAGDRVIVALSQVLGRDARVSDLVCRYGGEEFLVAMRGASSQEAQERAQSWRRALESTEIDLGGTCLRVTLSGGIATFPDDASDTATLLAHADEALYRAKQEGRNRIKAHGAS